MKVFFKNSFIKDFDSLPIDIKNEVRSICVEIFPRFESLASFKEHNIKKISGFSGYYRIRISDFRIGLKKDTDGSIVFMRVRHRKDIYKVFP